jgi:hypothetical protein
VADLTYNYLGNGSEANGAILREAALAAVGTGVRVAPFRDEYLTKLGVWLQGDPEEVARVVALLDEALERAKVEHTRMQWRGTTGKG